MKNSIFVVLLFWVFTLQVKATEYLVETKTDFENALKKVNPGDIIIWKEGNYSDIKIDFTPLLNGTSEKPIFLKAQKAGKVKFSGNSQLFIGGDYLVVQGFLFEGNCTLETNQNVIDFKSKDKKKLKQTIVD